MRRSVNVLLALSALVILLVGGALLFTLPHWLIRVGQGLAKGPDGTVSVVFIHRSTSGDVLFTSEDGSFSECYVLNFATNEIAIPSCGSVIHDFGIIAFSNESPISGVLASDRIKVERDLNVVINDKVIEFDTLSGYRILARRDGY